MLTKKHKYAIGVVALGKRPWLDQTYPTVIAYANRVGALPILLDSVPDESEFRLESLPEWIGRKNKLAYALKAYYPGQLLRDFEKVIILDDTCIVTSDTPNLFEILTPGSVAAVREPSHRGEETRTREEDSMFRLIKQFVKITNEPACFEDRDRYVNSGVVIYDKSSLDCMSAEKIINAQALLLSDFPHQTLLYYLLSSHNMNLQIIPDCYNNINIFTGNRSSANWHTSPLANAYIYHITGWWKDRESLIKIIVTRLAKEGRL